MDLEKVGSFSLHNGGGFVAKIQFKYLEDGAWKYSKKGSDITLGVTKKADPGEYGVPNGVPTRLKVFVVAGYDNLANQQFIYDKSYSETANYLITGTTLNNKLGLIESK
ncbi:hypothetical protein [Methanobacterium paludis]|uniref:Uncharacterized protein n=1 Tax=Methanobacterium paludis (strain DSM 25820 / JCM 18151 / SWAN1) TaxID=868131 RepID=F6D6Q9_METPW|nr:hypothetical protein [Methanobacterium paludis]AEG18342.1 hypothetical protein MSWAN_1327 [Methanobacterium paludis]